MDKDRFLKSCYGDKHGATLTYVNTLYDEFEELIEGRWETLDRIPADELLLKFFELRKSYSSMSSYSTVKQFVRSLYYYLYQHNLISGDTVLQLSKVSVSDFFTQDRIESNYFKNLEDILAHIQHSRRMLHCDKDSLIALEAAVVFLWHRFTVDEIITVKANDCRNGIIRSSTTNIQLTQIEKDIIDRYISASKYDGFPSGKKPVILAPSEYLFRGIHGQMNKEKFMYLFKHYNLVAKQCNFKPIKMFKIYDCRDMCDVKELTEQGVKLIDAVKQVTGLSDKSRVSKFTTTFKAWYNTFYGKEVDV